MARKERRTGAAPVRRAAVALLVALAACGPPAPPPTAAAARGAGGAAPPSDGALHLQRGASLERDGEPARALDEYRAALAADPGLAPAAYQVARFPDHGELPAEERRAAVEAALRGAAGLPEPARLVLRGWAARLDGRPDEALAAFEEAGRLAPGDLDAAVAAGEHLWHATRVEEALPWLERAHAIDPGFVRHAPHVVEALRLLDRGAEALAIARRAVEVEPRLDRTRRLLAGLLVDAGAFGEAIEVVNRLTTGHRDQPALTVRMVNGVLVPAGRLDEAEAIARALPAEVGVERDRQLADLLARQGRMREALALEAPGSPLAREAPQEAARTEALWRAALGDIRGAVAAARAVVRPDDAGDLLAVALALADAGAVDEAARLAKGFDVLAARARCPGDAWSLCDPRGPATVAAVLRFRRGGATERAAALAALRVLAGRRLDAACCWHGALAAEAGRDAEAVEALHRCGRGPGGRDAVVGPRARFLAARALERTGRSEQARAELEPLLAAWRRADPGLRHATEARALARRTGAAVP